MNYTNPFFPYTPYESQKLFMQNIIETLQHKRIGIFESPTGTGKSLTLLSAVMEFLQRENARLEESEKKDDGLDWLNDFGKNKKRTFTEVCEKKNEVIKQLKPEIKNQLKDEFDEFLLDYNQYKISNLNLESNKDKIQVFYCTRTHSQIAQIFSEIKKIKLHSKDFNFKCVSIGSRKHLCINTNVRKLENVYMINEKCKEIHRKDKCEFNKNIDVLTDIIHRKLLDIEEIYKLGNEIKICSYYSCRNSVTDADIIVIPYNQILHSSLRSSLNIDLKNKIVIFDEAHNLIDCLLSLYSVEITMEKIFCLFIQINFYYDKFKDRLKSLNSMYLRQLIRLMENFLIFFIDFTEGKLNLSSSTMSVTFLLFKCNINDIDFFRIRDFIEKAELVNKIDWFFDSIIKDITRFEKEYDKFVKETLRKNEKILKYFDRENEKIKEKFNSLKWFVMYFEKGFISQFSEFLRCITYLDEDGKISIERTEKNQVKMKYFMVNASREFDDLIKYSRNIIIAGGTLKPLQEFDILLSCLKKEEILYFEANHIINKENVLVRIVKKDLGNLKDTLKFNFESFKNNSECNYKQIHYMIEYFFDKVPGGIVVFLQNYEILSKLKNFLQEKSKLAQENLFFEEKINNTNTFSLYQAQINRNKKAVIFGIIGGKLSEGINFNDDLARCVIIIGLPYPSINSTDIKLKMEYYDYLYNKKVSEINGKEYYENLCMKAVNQSIGRAIRHKNDYSMIVLADIRFTNERIMNKLPKWILDTKVKEVDDIEVFKGEMKEFYASHNNN